ncbi:hypothetical protein GLE_4497 [Lysobacter enzymogenes]|uniref:Uncharacterized protein n=1 Tax=Lysobacter enzymogenes TaxID=69 RepID=A0A0S2DMI7_LYSEN|nr:hypothetical protein GLE_4497 [Lysobacter enzymogenes]
MPQPAGPEPQRTRVERDLPPVRAAGFCFIFPYPCGHAEPVAAITARNPPYR